MWAQLTACVSVDKAQSAATSSYRTYKILDFEIVQSKLFHCTTSTVILRGFVHSGWMGLPHHSPVICPFFCGLQNAVILHLEHVYHIDFR